MRRSRARSFGETDVSSRSARDTVITLTPAAAAIIRKVTRL
jgi:hypothetical protein